MLIVPLQPTPNQAVTVELAGQNCQINVYQKFFGLFLDLYRDNSLVLAGALCQNRNRLVRSPYLGFSGDLAFLENQGDNDPAYAGLGTRFCLAYLSADEAAG